MILRASRRTAASAAKAAQGAPLTIPAPVGGLNARDNLAEMPPTDAVVLTNWFPEAQYCAIRGGSASWGTGVGTGSTPVQSLMPWNNPAGSDKLFAAAASTIYDVSTAGAGSSVVTGLSNATWQHTNFTTPGGTFLVACNGADSVRNYDGSSWTTPSITGVTSSTLVNVLPFAKRLFFVANGSLSLWYLGLQSIAGAATEFPLGSVFKKGGFIQALGDFSNDSGDGQYSYLAIITNKGEVAVYQGTDPTSSATWNLVGLYNTAPPIGRRCIERLNGDLGIVTVDGVISMRGLLQFDRDSDQKAAFTGKIQTLFAQLAGSYKSNSGWQIFIYPEARYCIVNYPIISSSQQAQIVMNTVTGAWCQFTNLNAGCWGSANGNLFFGGNNGTVYQANTGTKDSGSNINADIQPAWNLLGSPDKKTVSALKPILLTGGGVSYALNMQWDFGGSAPTNSVVPSPVSGATWPMTWPFTWAGVQPPTTQWHGGGGIGTWGSPRLVMMANTSAKLHAFSCRVLPATGAP